MRHGARRSRALSGTAGSPREDGGTRVRLSCRLHPTSPFRGEDGKVRFRWNDFAGLTPALLAGRGIGELPPVVQPELLRTGRLVEVMPDWRFPSFDLSLVHLGNRHLAKPCRLFKEFATQMAQALFPDLPG